MNKYKAEITEYSDQFAGDVGNYYQNVRFDFTSGYLGITQWANQRGAIDRILLSPKQVKLLKEFLNDH